MFYRSRISFLNQPGKEMGGSRTLQNKGNFKDFRKKRSVPEADLYQ